MVTIYEVEAVIETINGREGLCLRLKERCEGGEQGAFLVSDAEGSAYVLKLTSVERLAQLEQTMRVTACLRSLGYPAPRYACVGTVEGRTYSLQEALPGKPLMNLTQQAQLQYLLSLNTLQQGLAQELDLTSHWPAPVVETVLVGGDGFCILDTLRLHSSASAELLTRCQELVRTYADAVASRNDIVHMDFHLHNILAIDNEIKGIIDWEGCFAGDATFDLATLLFYCYSNQVEYGDNGTFVRALWNMVTEQAGIAALRVYLAHMLVRQTEWSLRLHAREVGEHWLRVARIILHDLNAGHPFAE